MQGKLPPMIGHDLSGSGPGGHATNRPDTRIQLSAGDLLGRTHEELVLLLIQLRRQSSALLKARDACLLEMESQVCGKKDFLEERDRIEKEIVITQYRHTLTHTDSILGAGVSEPCRWAKGSSCMPVHRYNVVARRISKTKERKWRDGHLKSIYLYISLTVVVMHLTGRFQERCSRREESALSLMLESCVYKKGAEGPSFFILLLQDGRETDEMGGYCKRGRKTNKTLNLEGSGMQRRGGVCKEKDSSSKASRDSS